VTELITPLPGVVRETRVYRLPQGGSFSIRVVPDQPGELWIGGIGRDQDLPADEALAARIDRLCDQVVGITRTWGTTWSVTDEALDAIHALLGPVACRTVEIANLPESAAAWRAMRSSLPGRLDAWWSWSQTEGCSPTRVQARSECPGDRIGLHIVDHGRPGLAWQRAQRLIERIGPEIDEPGIDRFVEALGGLGGEFAGFSAAGW